MSRIFLIATNTAVDPYPVYPLGMAVVAEALCRAGHETRQFDWLAEGSSAAALVDAVRLFKPDLVGLSIRNLDDCDSMTVVGEMLSVEKEVMAAVRRATGAPVVLGGSAFSLMPETVLECLGADAGVVGEGERTVVALAEDFRNGRPPAGVYRDERLLAPGEMCRPLWDASILAHYRDASGLVNLQTKRGCPYSCRYCSYPLLEGSRFRCRDPQAVVDDIVRLQAEHGATMLFFTDSIFNDPDGHHLLVAEALLRRGVSISWSAFFRPQGFNLRDMAVLKRAGLSAVELGSDAASDATLAGLDKGFDFADVAAANRVCAEMEIPCAHYVMFGGPSETDGTVRQGLENLALLEYGVVFGFAGIRILPGTAMQKLALADGIIAADTPLLAPVYYFSPQVDRQEMIRVITEAFDGRRDRIFPPSEGQLRLAVMKRFGYRGVLWDKLVNFSRRSPGHRTGTMP